MNPDPDELKKVWQLQTTRRMNVDAGILLQEFRRSKQNFILRVLVSESVLILGLVALGGVFVLAGVSTFQDKLPASVFWALFGLGGICLGVAGYKGFDRLLQLRRRASVSDPVLACVQEQLDWVRHEIRLWGRLAFWWYLLPLALGELVLLLSVRYAAGGPQALLNLPVVVDVVAAGGLVWAAQRFLRWWVGRYYAPRERELDALLQSLRS